MHASMIALLLVAASPAAASDVMGMFFDPDDHDEESSVVDTQPGVPFQAYVVLLDASPGNVGGYEVGITLSSSTVTSLGVTGPNGWTNFGDDFNHLVGYMTPLSASSSGVVLCTLSLMQMDDAEVQVEYGPASPASISGVPVIADGDNPNDLYECELFGGGPVVAQLNAPPPRFEDVPLSHVKGLFD